MNCPRCGIENPDRAAKCSQCGVSFAVGADAETFAGIVTAPTATGAAGAAPARAPQVPIPTPSSSLPLADAATTGPWDAAGAAPPRAPQAPSPSAGDDITSGPWLPRAPQSPSPSMADAVTSGPWGFADSASDQVNFGARYKVQRMLGQGGMGAVYQAYDTELDRTVALKQIRPGLAMDPGVMQRFKQELLLASKISHKNILRIHDLGDAGGVKFISMAYVEGHDLYHLVADGAKLPVDRALKIAVQMCAALDAAHNEGVVHRDFKPQNILLDSNDQVYVTDFGLAKSLETDAGLSRSGEFLGTPRYMAPEQVEGRGIDHRVDIYALGLVLYEMLTGDLPLKAESTVQLLYKRVHETPKSPKELNPELPDWLVKVVMKCLERDPDKRYQNASDIRIDLQNQMAPVGAKSGSGSIAFTVRRVEMDAPAAKIGLWVAIAMLVIAAITFGVPSLRHKVLGEAAHAGPAKPITVLVADFENHTGDPVFDGTLEPMLNVAMEGAKFINAFNRGSARKIAQSEHGSSKLDEQTARLVALSQGIATVVTGDISRRGDNYELTAIALDANTGNVEAKADVTASNKDAVLSVIPKLAAPIRKALGDNTPESVQIEKQAGAFTSSNLEAVHDYGVGMEQQFGGDIQKAYQSFGTATQLDPNFARAYAGMAGISWNTGKMSDAEKNMNVAMAHVDRMTDRERYRMRAAYFMMTSNWQKCVEEFSALVNSYPADNIGNLNLAGCEMGLRNVPKAVEAARKAVEITPKGVLQRLNLSFYSSYGGDFATGEAEAQNALKLNSSSETSYLALAEAQAGAGKVTEATQSYTQLQNVSALGASMSNAGVADLASYQGRYGDAISILEKGVAADLAAKTPESAAEKLATIARLELWRGHKSAAEAAADKALATNGGGKIRFLVAETLLDAGDAAKAQKIVAGFEAALQAEPQAYFKIVSGRAALARGDKPAAIKALTDANAVLNTWLGHFELGRAYLQAGAYVEAAAEFDECTKRRGEALEILMDNYPTYAYFPLVYYYQGRAREGLKSPGAVESYRQYLNVRGQSNEDPLVTEIRQRVAQSGQ